jgi:phage major head subunit gpT-like protein
MIINHANLNSFFRGLKTEFFNSLNSAAKVQWSEIATKVNSTTSSEDYGWMGEVGPLREWIGPRIIQRLKAYNYTVANRLFEGTVGVKKTDLEDDHVGVYSLWAQSLGAAAAKWPDDMVFGLFLTADVDTCYDGQPFFDTEHPVGRDTVTLTSNLLNDGGVNAAAPWYLLDTTRPIKPMLYQKRLDPEFAVRTNITDEHVFNLDEYLAGVRARGNAGFGLWQTAQRNEGALDQAGLEAGILAMNSLVNDEGRELGINPNVLLVGRSKQFAAPKLIGAEYIDADLNPNPLFNSLRIVVVTELP